MTTLTLEECGGYLTPSPFIETVFAKPVMGKDADGNFYWSTAAHALRKDERGWHDRPLLNPDFTREEQKP